VTVNHRVGGSSPSSGVDQTTWNSEKGQPIEADLFHIRKSWRPELWMRGMRGIATREERDPVFIR
jgi:hypothetical protein